MLRRICIPGLLILCSLTLGCTCHLTTVPDVDADLQEACAAIACDSRSHVYLFFLKGCDPVDCAGVGCLKDTLASLGFGKSWCGNDWHLKAMKKEISGILHDDPKAHLVLVGYGKGIDTAVELAKVIEKQNSQVYLFVGLGERVECPRCVHRQLTLVPEDCGGDDKDVFAVRCSKKSKLPGHPDTIDMLSKELCALAGGIPSECDLPKLYHHEKEPTPRPVMPSASVKRDAWDFLKPSSADEREGFAPGTLPVTKPTRTTSRRN